MQNRSMDRYWMPFTALRDFLEAPRLIVGAKGHHYVREDGERLYDGFAGLWTSGLGHCHPRIVEAVQRQVAQLDYSMAFQVSHPDAFVLSDRLCAVAPENFGSVFYTNSGSESADTSLKLALAYHRARGEGQRVRFIGRERGYHGVNFGGISVGGISPNRKVFSGNLLPAVDHLPHTHDPVRNRFSRGQPQHGAELADRLEDLCSLHDPSTIAAVIVEPVAGSTGILPPPQGYLERLRAICDRHGILLIFDEVITAFGRIGEWFAASRFGVTPDIINCAKGLTNGVVPMGAVLCRQSIRDALMTGPGHAIELFHGYTYSGHPLAVAAANATLDVYEEEGSFAQARALEPQFEDLLHSFAGHPLVADVRNFGLMGGIELNPIAGKPGLRGHEIYKHLFWEENLVVRAGGDTLQFSPFLNSRPDDLEAMFAGVRRALDQHDQSQSTSQSRNA